MSLCQNKVDYYNKEYFAVITLFNGPNKHHEPTNFNKICKLNDTEICKL